MTILNTLTYGVEMKQVETEQAEVGMAVQAEVGMAEQAFLSRTSSRLPHSVGVPCGWASSAREQGRPSASTPRKASEVPHGHPPLFQMGKVVGSW